MTSPSDNELAASARRELLEDILPFWRRHAVDERRGGFIGQMSNDLHVQDDAPKGLILNARILWTFSAAYAYTQDETGSDSGPAGLRLPDEPFSRPGARRLLLGTRSERGRARRQEEDLRRGVLPLRPGRVLSRFRRGPGPRTGDRTSSISSKPTLMTISTAATSKSCHATGSRARTCGSATRI